MAHPSIHVSIICLAQSYTIDVHSICEASAGVCTADVTRVHTSETAGHVGHTRTPDARGPHNDLVAWLYQVGNAHLRIGNKAPYHYMLA